VWLGTPFEVNQKVEVVKHGLRWQADDKSDTRQLMGWTVKGKNQTGQDIYTNVPPNSKFENNITICP
jgi:hypothetical protein